METVETQSALLLLPQLSPSIQRSSLHSAYSITLRTAFRKLLKRGTETRGCKRLDIAFFDHNVIGVNLDVGRAFSFPRVQHDLEEFYRLICVAATEEQMDLDFPGGIDARVFFLRAQSLDLVEESKRVEKFSGPVVSFQTFAAAKRSYSVIYAAESEDGGNALDAVLEAFRLSNSPPPPLERLPCGTAISVTETRQPKLRSNLSPHYSVAVGGTFDHLHIGHKLLLSAVAFVTQPTDPAKPDQSRQITVGITGDELLVNKKFASQVESWSSRQQATAEFVESILVFHPDIPGIRTTTHIDEPGPNGKIVRVTYGTQLTINYTQISDPFGPTITDEGISALVISKETRAGGKAVNDKRKEKGWKELEVFEVDVLDVGAADSGDDQAEDAGDSPQTFEAKISSTEIRRRLEEMKKT